MIPQQRQWIVGMFFTSVVFSLAIGVVTTPAHAGTVTNVVTGCENGDPYVEMSLNESATCQTGGGCYRRLYRIYSGDTIGVDLGSVSQGTTQMGAVLQPQGSAVPHVTTFKDRARYTLLSPGLTYRYAYNDDPDLSTSLSVPATVPDSCGKQVTVLPTDHSVTVQPGTGTSWDGKVTNPPAQPVPVVEQSPVPAASPTFSVTSSDGWNDGDRAKATERHSVWLYGGGSALFLLAGLVTFGLPRVRS